MLEQNEHGSCFGKMFEEEVWTKPVAINWSILLDNVNTLVVNRIECLLRKDFQSLGLWVQVSYD